MIASSIQIICLIVILQCSIAAILWKCKWTPAVVIVQVLITLSILPRENPPHSYYVAFSYGDLSSFHFFFISPGTAKIKRQVKLKKKNTKHRMWRIFAPAKGRYAKMLVLSYNFHATRRRKYFRVFRLSVRKTRSYDMAHISHRKTHNFDNCKNVRHGIPLDWCILNGQAVVTLVTSGESF